MFYKIITGERELIGHLRSTGLMVQRSRVRDSIHTINPLSTAFRWFEPINKRCYSVLSPNSVWHMDGNLKLIRWGFVIYAAFDGYSRLIVFARVSLNNRADTVLQYF